jgi:hypothetical protein
MSGTLNTNNAIINTSLKLGGNFVDNNIYQITPNITTPTNGQALTYNSTTSKWVNTTAVGPTGATGATGATGPAGTFSANQNVTSISYSNLQIHFK